MARLGRAFFARSALTVAPDLLGKFIVFRGQVGRIVETEAYLGPEDLASHARFSSRRRNAIMFGPAGLAYVYLTYGLHHLLNIVTEKEGQAGAVLVRSLQPVSNIDQPTNGPARLTKALEITLSQNGVDLTKSTSFYLKDEGDKIGEIVKASRIGIDYAGEYKDKPWRFYINGNSFVSRK
jgi:DNA-3-methyladenine glycosylase